MVRILVIAISLVVVSWAVMVVLAKRLPPCTLKDLATVLPACVTTVRRLRKDPRVPRSVKVAVALAAVWVVSPIDLLPEFLPVIGPLDDVVVVALALRFAARRVPHEAIFEAWPADPALLARLLRTGPPAPQQAADDDSPA
ncbi:MAG: YkvA family protein [Acidimicrobiia bacterium]